MHRSHNICWCWEGAAKLSSHCAVVVGLRAFKFAALEHTRPAEFLGSFADCLPSLLLIPGTPAAPVLTLLQKPVVWSQPTAPAMMSGAAGRGAWGTPTALSLQ